MDTGQVKSMMVKFTGVIPSTYEMLLRCVGHMNVSAHGVVVATECDVTVSRVSRDCRRQSPR